MSGDTHYFPKEAYTGYNLKAKELNRVKKIMDSYRQKPGLELVLGHFEKFNLDRDHFELLYIKKNATLDDYSDLGNIKEARTEPSETESIFCFADEQMPDKQRIKYLDLFLGKENLDLFQKFGLDNMDFVGISYTDWLEKNYGLDRIINIGKERNISLLKTY
jgi:hypothetical protein